MWNKAMMSKETRALLRKKLSKAELTEKALDFIEEHPNRASSGIESFESGYVQCKEDLRALLKERMTPHKEAMKYLKPDSCGYSIRANILHEYEELLASLGEKELKEK